MVLPVGRRHITDDSDYLVGTDVRRKEGGPVRCLLMTGPANRNFTQTAWGLVNNAYDLAQQAFDDRAGPFGERPLFIVQDPRLRNRAKGLILSVTGIFSMFRDPRQGQAVTITPKAANRSPSYESAGHFRSAHRHQKAGLRRHGIYHGVCDEADTNGRKLSNRTARG